MSGSGSSRRHGSLVLALAAALSAALPAGCRAPGPRPVGAKPYLQASDADLAWFREARFGLFIHWGPVSLKGTEIGWSRGGDRRGRSGSGTIPADVYDDLYKEFNPVEFNADEWVNIARSAGMKYLVFTSKHHDGFSMFDTRLSDYKITNSPFRRDVCAELADACHRAGLRIGWYYSPVDWHHPDYRTANHRRYVAYMHGQLRELCTRYGRIDVIWFDGLGGTADDWDSENLFKMIRCLQPGILINNRAGLPGDFGTPEQYIGRADEGRLWETCMTIGDQWSYKPDDRIKSTPECLEVLVKTAGGGGNLLFNVGPTPRGTLEPLQVARLKDMGAFLAKNGAAIYATGGGPFPRDAWGVSTARNNTVYLHILAWDGDGVTIPPVPARVVSAALLAGSPVPFTQTDKNIRLLVPADRRDPFDTIVVLLLDRPADTLAAKTLPSGSLARGGKGSQTGTGRDDKDNPPANALDDDYTTVWVAHIKTPPARLEVDLGQPLRIDRVGLCEILDRTREFVIEGRRTPDDPWQELARGTTIGQKRTLSFPPVLARFARISFLKIDGTRGAQLAEFQVFAPEK